MHKDFQAKYGSPKSIKYLVCSLDDIHDVIDAVKQMIKNNCQPEDSILVQQAISINAIPINNRLSSFIMILKVPSYILESKFARSTAE